MKKYIIICLVLLVSNLYSQTANYKIVESPTGTLLVTLIPVASMNISSLSLQIQAPPMTTITNLTYFDINGPAIGTTAVAPKSSPANAFGVTADILGTYMPSVEIPIMSFKFTSTAPPGTTGAFTVLDNGQNYIEMEGNDVTGPPTNNANAVVLPIKLSKFDVKPFGGIKASDLRWSSASEINASAFEIERSNEGIDFAYVGTVKATGNSTWNVDYNFVDRTLPTSRTNEEIYYYRLKMIDLDGKFEYSDVRSIRFDNTDAVTIKMGPNPTTSIVKINMSSPNTTDEDAPANIYNIDGKLVQVSKVNTNGVTELNLVNLPNAIYNISIEHNGKVYNNRVIKTN